MAGESIDPIRPALVGIGAISACTVAVTVFAFNTDALIPAALAVGAIVGLAISSIVYYGIVRPLLTDLAAARTAHSITQHQLVVSRTRRSFLEQLDVSLESAESEDQAIDVAGRALSILLPQRDNSILLSPPTGAKVTWMIEASADGLGHPSILETAKPCVALATRTSVVAETSDAGDACSHLTEHDWEVSSLCVPIFVGEQHLGVAHSAGPAGDVPDEEAVRILETVTRRVGGRIAQLRQARRYDYTLPLDSVTQLPTQSLAVRELRQLIIDDSEFSLAICDFDGFAGYNSEFGADVGDRALRSYSDVLGATLRPTDVIARFEGDRFICLFPNCTPLHATAAMERVRESLILNLAMSELSPFSVSVGIAGSEDGESAEELIDLAVTAMTTAKHAGGNRVAMTGRLEEMA